LPAVGHVPIGFAVARDEENASHPLEV
jgi:hypothetical protein